MQQILGYAGTLSLPVAPYAHDAVMDMVAADSPVYGSVKLDACGLGAAELL